MRKKTVKPVEGEAPEPVEVIEVTDTIELPEALCEMYELKHLSTPYLETGLFGRIDVRKLTAEQAEAMVNRGSAYVVKKVFS